MTRVYPFWFDGRKFETDKPRMTMAELKALTGATPGYHAYREREGGDLPIGEGEAVDMAGEPHFWAAPPATMFG